MSLETTTRVTATPAAATTRVTATQVDDSASAHPLSATITRQQDLGKRAQVTHIQKQDASITKVHQIGKHSLFTTFRGTRAHLDLSEKGLSKREKSLWGQTEKQMDEIWEKAKQLLPPDANGLRVNLTQCYIAYRTIDAAGKETVHYLGKTDLEKQNPDLMDLMEQVRGSAKVLWKRLFMPTEAHGNRPISPNKPFEIVSDKWEKVMPRTLGKYMKPAFFGKLAQVIAADPPGTSPTSATDRQHKIDKAFDRTIATEVFQRNLHYHISRLRQSREGLIKNEKFSTFPKAERQLIIKQKADLESLEKMALPQLFKRDAVMPAVALWGDTDPRTATKEDRYRIGDQVQLTIKSTLMSRLEPDVDDRGWITKQWQSLTGENTGYHLEGVTPMIDSYAANSGSLVINDKFEAIERDDALGEAYKGVSMEQFVTECMKHFDNGAESSFDISKALDALGIQFDQESRKALVNAITESRTAAHTAVDAVKETRGQSWEARWEAAQKRPDLKVYLD